MARASSRSRRYKDGVLPEQILPWIVGPITVAALGLIAARGWWRADAFDGAPPRDVGLAIEDILIGLGAYLVGKALASWVIAHAGSPDPPVAHTFQDRAVIAIVQQVIGHGPLIVLFLIMLRRRPDGLQRVGIAPRQPKRAIVEASVALLIGVSAVLALNFLCVWIGKRMGEPEPEVGHILLEIVRHADSILPIALLSVSAVILAPILEELVFRGFLQTALLSIIGGSNRRAVVLLSALIFAAVHGGVAQWQTLPGLFVLGVIFGWLYERRGNLLPCILTHMAFNATMIALTLLTRPVD